MLNSWSKLKNNSWIMMVIGCMTVLCFYFTMCLATVSPKYNVLFLYAICSVLTAILYVFCFYLTFGNDKLKWDIKKQLIGVNSGMLVIGVLVTCGMFSQLWREKNYIFLFSLILWTTVLFLNEIWVLHLLDKSNIQKLSGYRENVFSKLGKIIYKNRYMLVLSILVLVLSIDTEGAQFKWDGALYYEACQNLSLFSISSLAVYGHIAQTYSALIAIGTSILGNVACGMMACNIFLLLVSTWAFFSTIRYLVPSKKESLYIFGTAIYAFSPFLLGLVNYYNLDYACLCLSVFVFLFYCKRQWIYFFLFSLLFCFTKEPAIIVYGSMCVGIVLTDFVRDKEKNVGKRFLTLFSHKQYYLMVLPGILWSVTYFILGPWGAGNASAEINISYIFEKLKVLYLLNFNWIFTLIIVVGIGYMLKHKILFSPENAWMFALFIGQGAFTVFSCLLKTVNHPRYSDSSPAFLYLISVVLLMKLCKRTLPWCLKGLAALMLISSFYTLDPVSKLLFKTVNVGSTDMLVVQEYEPGDGMIYNKQLLGLESAMNMALCDSVDNREVIIFPAVDENTYYFDGMASVTNVSPENYIRSEEWWNQKTKSRSLLESSDTKKFEVYHVVSKNGIAKVLEENEKKQYSYFFLPFAGQELAGIIKDNYDVLKEETFKYKGWTVTKIVFISCSI